MNVTEATEAFFAQSQTIEGLLSQLRPYVDRMEAKGIDCTYMRGKIAGLEIALEMLGDEVEPTP